MKSVPEMKNALEVDVREKRFVAPDGSRRVVLRDVAFRTRPGEFVALVGPSGCGKTTLLNIIAGLDASFVGSVRGGGGPPSPVRVGYVFQEPRLLPWLTVFENIALVLPRDFDPATIEALLAEVGMAAARDVNPPRLSTGMARRAAIARAFAVEPELLVMDEPFVSLDETMAERLRRLLIGLWRSRPTSVVFVTHDLREAVELADRILLLSGPPGRLLADVPIPLPREHRTDPAAVAAIRAAIAERHRHLLGEEASIRPPAEGAAISASRDTR